MKHFTILAALFYVITASAQQKPVDYSEGAIFEPALEHDKSFPWEMWPVGMMNRTLYFLEEDGPTAKKKKHVLHMFDTLGRHTGQIEIKELAANDKKMKLERVATFDNRILLLYGEYSKAEEKTTIYCSVLDMATGLPGAAMEIGSFNGEDNWFGGAAASDGQTFEIVAQELDKQSHVCISFTLDKTLKVTAVTKEKFDVPVYFIVDEIENIFEGKNLYCVSSDWRPYKDAHEGGLIFVFKDKKTGEEKKAEVTEKEYIRSFKCVKEGENLVVYYTLGTEDDGFKMRKRIYDANANEVSRSSLDNIFSEADQESFFVNKKIKDNYFVIRFAVPDKEGNIHLVIENKEVATLDPSGTYGDIIYLKFDQDMKILDKKISARRHSLPSQQNNGYGEFMIGGSHFIFIPDFELFANQATNEEDKTVLQKKPMKQGVIRIDEKGGLIDQELKVYDFEFRSAMKMTFRNGFGPNFNMRKIVHGNTVYVLSYSTGPYIAKYVLNL